MQPGVDVQDVDGAPEAGLDEMKPSDRHGDYENIVPQSVDQSNLNRSSKAGKQAADFGSGLVEKDGASSAVNDDLKHTATPSNVHGE